ncbi:hypothetical protein EVG20_g4924 [Dentipellis fragilis]|uniref:F-box domain-containing protein n=1 Tax=Dentipellis fragilis TaxID=205917 RepID=A0A4Y9YUS1_9AGAM|nr:hypothetical protein EVG20_g4924 [Dentipellis fragilis]
MDDRDCFAKSERTVDQCIALRRKNAALPFCKLPPEICSRVFYALAAIDSPFHPIPPKRFHEDYILHGPGYPSGKDDRPTTFGWINLTHVCYVWRNAAFGYASIWKNIPSTFGWRCAQEFAHRAQQMPIRYVRVKPVCEHEAYCCIRPHLKHIEEIDITDGSRGQWDVFPYLAEPAPILRRLALQEKTSRPAFCDLVAVDLFKGDTPLLRDVFLRIFPVPWGSRIFRNLVSLDIKLPFAARTMWVDVLGTEHHPLVPTHAQLLVILKNCASTLEVFELNLCSLLCADDVIPALPFSTSERVLLPRLAVLYLGLCTPDFIALFSRIDILPETEIEVTLWDALDDSSGNDALLFVSSFQRHAESRLAADVPFTHLCVCNVNHEFYLDGPVSISVPGDLTVSLSSVSAPSATCTFHVDCEFTPEYAAATEPRWLEAFLSWSSLCTITDLTVDVGSRLAGEWHAFAGFSSLPSVRRLQIVAVDRMHFADELELQNCLVRGDGAAPAPFPNLETLVVDMTWESMDDTKLAAAVEQRRAAGGPLKEIVSMGGKRDTKTSVTKRGVDETTSSPDPPSFPVPTLSISSTYLSTIMTDQTTSMVKSDARTLGACYILRQQNATRPFCKLPIEIRGYILQILVAIDPHSTPQRPDIEFLFPYDRLIYPENLYDEDTQEAPDVEPLELPTLGWIQATHICSAWRDAAIAWKYIWTDIPPMLSSRCAQAFAQRAGTMRMRYVRTKPLNAPEAYDMTTHLHHIAELDLDLTADFTPERTARDEDFDGASRAALEPQHPPFHLAPVLRRLALRSDGLISDHGSAVLAGLFAGGAPDLRDVVLHMLPVPWGSVARVFRNLVSLDIALPNFGNKWKIEAQHMPTCTQVLAILTACAPTLEVVKLDLGRYSFEESMEPAPSASTADSEELIVLPRLTIFCLDTHPANFLAIFKRVKVPPSAAISGALLAGHRSSFRDARLLLSSLKRHAAWRLAVGAPFARLDVESDGCHPVLFSYLALRLSSESTTCSVPPCTFRIIFKKYTYNSSTLEARWLGAFLRTVPLGTITDFRINASDVLPDEWSPVAWFCSRMPHVRRLQISSDDLGYGLPRCSLKSYEVETMGCFLLGDYTSPTPTAVPFPHLETLAVDTAKLRKCIYSGIEYEAKSFARLLQTRRSVGGPLKEIVLVESKECAGMGSRDAVLVAALKAVGLEDLQVSVSVQ